MNKFLRLVLIAITVLGLAGCGQQGGVAVLDLDKAGSALGRDKAINEKVNQFNAGRQQEVNKLREQLRANIANEKKKIGDKPSDAEQRQYNQLLAASQQRLNQTVARFNQESRQLRINLVQEFRKEVEPVAQRVASEQGLSVVILKVPQVLSFDSKVDITDKVVSAMQSGK